MSSGEQINNRILHRAHRPSIPFMLCCLCRARGCELTTTLSSLPIGTHSPTVAVPAIGLLIEHECWVRRGLSPSYFPLYLGVWKQTGSQSRFLSRARVREGEMGTGWFFAGQVLSFLTTKPIAGVFDSWEPVEKTGTGFERLFFAFDSLGIPVSTTPSGCFSFAGSATSSAPSIHSSPTISWQRSKIVYARRRGGPPRLDQRRVILK